jgi:MFS family permease
MKDAAGKETKQRSFFTKSLPLFVLAHFSHHLMTALPVPLLPFIRSDFGLDYTQSAFVISAFSLAYGVSQLPSGWLADRIGRRTLIAIGMVGVAVAGFLVGLSHTFVLMLILLVLMGVVGGGYHPAATPWVSASAGERSQGRALGIHFIGGGAGFFLAPIIGAAIAAAWGWRSAFIILAIPSVGYGIFFYFFLRRQADGSQLKPVVSEHPGANGPTRNNWPPLIALIALGLIAGGMSSVMSFLPLYLVDEFHTSEQVAGSMVALTSFAGLWAGPVGGYLSDRLGRVPIILSTFIIGGIFISVVRVLPFGIGLFSLLFFIGVNIYLGMPVSEAFIMGQTSARNRSLIYGVYYLASQGGALFAPLMGHLIDNIGFRSTVTIAGFSTVGIALICGIFLWRARERSPMALG